MQSLEQLHAEIAQKAENICAICACKNGETFYEDTWNDFAPNDSANVMSVTKSILSLLIGIARDQGLIESVDRPVLDFFPGYVPPRGEKTIQNVTLRHLLTMTAPYKYRSEPWTKVCTSGDWTRAALDLLGGRKGITGNFLYATLGSQILSGVIHNQSGLTPAAFANRYLFAPLGIAPHENAAVENREQQADFLFSKKPKGNVWIADPQGVNTAGWGLSLSARDLARIGQMCLAGGEMDGRRIVSESWLRESTRPYQTCGEAYGNMQYGFLWWVIDASRGIYAAIGDGGNVLYVDPSRSITVGVTANFKPRVFDRVQLIQNCIVPLSKG